MHSPGNWPPAWFYTTNGWLRFLKPHLVLPRSSQMLPTLAVHYGMGILGLAIAWRSRHKRQVPERILWTGRCHLGDFLMSVPGLATLRAQLPKAWICTVFQDRYLGQLDLRSLANAEVSDIDDELPLSEQIRLWRKRYRDLGIDCVIFHRITRPDLAPVLAAWLENIPHRLGGMDKGLQGFLTDFYAPTRREKVAHYSQHLVENWLGLSGQALHWPDMIPVALTRRVPRWDVVIAPFAQHTKLWPEENWRALLAHFQKHSLRVALSAGPPSREAARELLAGHPEVENLAERTTSLQELFEIVKSTQVLISIDTGIRHVAAVVGVPCVVIANEREHRDVIGGYTSTERFLVHDVPCAPCGAEPCPLGHLQCVRGITVPEVLEALRAVAPNLP